MSGLDFPTTLAPEMAALAARILTEDGPQPDPTLLPPSEGRRAAEIGNRRWNVALPEMERVAIAHVPGDPALGSAEVRLLVLVPPAAREGAIFFIHGGGFAFCSPETHERCALVLAAETGLPVILPDYRLAPEHPFPAGLLDVVASWRAAFDATASLGVRSGPLILAGDSAGAGLCVSALLHEEARTPADSALLFYGVYDADFDTPSYRVFADGPGLTRAKMQRYWDFYVADEAARRTPLAAPLLASDAALGRPERTSVVPGVVHGFLQMSHDLPQAREALGQAADFVKSRI